MDTLGNKYVNTKTIRLVIFKEEYFIVLFVDEIFLKLDMNVLYIFLIVKQKLRYQKIVFMNEMNSF